MSTEKTIDKKDAESEKVLMSCAGTIYLNDENTTKQMDDAQLIAVEFGLNIGEIRIDQNTIGIGIVTEVMSTDDCTALVGKLSDAGITFTTVLDVTVPAPEKPYLIIHYANASKRTLRRINSLIEWIDSNEPTALIGAVTDMPNSRPEDGIQIEFKEQINE